ncbi:MAG: hypothetical protein V9F04_14465 [Dermatophilaceae bacterium]
MRGSRSLRVVLLLVCVVAVVAVVLRRRSQTPDAAAPSAGTRPDPAPFGRRVDRGRGRSRCRRRVRYRRRRRPRPRRARLRAPKGRCRAEVPPGTTLARVPDRVLAAAVVEGVDVDAGTYPLFTDADHDWSARDCVGDELLFGPPSDAKPRWYAPLATPLEPLEEEDAGVLRGPFRNRRADRCSVARWS